MTESGLRHPIHHLAEDELGNILVATDAGITRFVAGRFTNYRPPRDSDLLFDLYSVRATTVYMWPPVTEVFCLPPANLFD